MKNEYFKAEALYFGCAEMVLMLAIVGVCVI
jgi:hypothetical protein